jgi:hypothetical protein
VVSQPFFAEDEHVLQLDHAFYERDSCQDGFSPKYP